MATIIADTACVDPRAELADDVEIGPYCIIGPDVKIGRGTRLIGHVCILGVTTLGEHNVISPFAVIGGDPQDVSYQGTPTRIEIGDLLKVGGHFIHFVMENGGDAQCVIRLTGKVVLHFSPLSVR